MTDFEQPNQ